jgi:serine/threonine-protein kinase
MPGQDPYIGQEILNGQFKILKRIGTGGMGSVYKASQPEMNRMVAVKILHTKLTDRKDLASRFRREARALSHLTHPNTVKVMMYGELDNGSLYIVMEYLDGKNLNQVVRRGGPLPVERAIPVLIQACGALHEAHQLGIVHRDIKPENIFLTRHGGMDDFVKVLDFGLAKVTERELRPGSIMLTQEGMVFGTPEFMSPEQAQGQVLDPRADIYSLAVILYEALTGKLPFDGKTPMQFIQLHVTRAPIPLDERLPDKTFPPGLSDVVAKALSKSRSKRYQTALEFAEALRPFAPGTAVPFVDVAAVHGGVAPASWSSQEGDVPSEPVDSTASPTWVDPSRQPGARRGESSTDPAPTVPRGAAQATAGTSPRTLIIVAALSIVAGVVLTVLALKLFG